MSASGEREQAGGGESSRAPPILSPDTISGNRRVNETGANSDGPTNGDARIAAVSQMNDEWNLQALVDDEEGSSGLVRYNSIGYWAREKLKRKGKIVFYTRAKPGYWEPRPNH